MSFNLDNIDSKDKIIIIGHSNPDVDSIVSGYLLEKLLRKKKINAEFIIPDLKIEQENIDICNKYGLDPTIFQKELPKEKSKYILVDHNNSLVNGEVICIIDHHPFIEGVNANNIYNKNISSASCFICKDNEKYFSKEDLTLACVATMVDTASFHSSKSRDIDKEWVKKMCFDYNIDYDDIYKTGLCLTDISNINIAAFNGIKKYSFNGIKLESSYIQVEDAKNNHKIISEIINYLKSYLIDNELDCFVFIYHNMTDFESTAYRIDTNDVVTYHFDQYTARGSKIIPTIKKDLLKKIDIKCKLS